MACRLFLRLSIDAMHGYVRYGAASDTLTASVLIPLSTSKPLSQWRVSFGFLCPQAKVPPQVFPLVFFPSSFSLPSRSHRRVPSPPCVPFEKEFVIYTLHDQYTDFSV